MKIENWISVASTFIAALIVATGWLVTGYQNRRKDVAQKRLEYRLKALESFLPVFFTFQKERSIDLTKPANLSALEDARSKFLLYGYQDEIDRMEKFIQSVQSNDLSIARAALNELISLTRGRIRSELEISD